MQAVCGGWIGAGKDFVVETTGKAMDEARLVMMVWPKVAVWVGNDG